MTRTLLKWTYRCLGWIILGGLALVLLAAYAVDKYEGYGTLALRLTWNHQPYLPSSAALAAASFKVRQRSYPLDLNQPLRLRPGPAAVEVKMPDFSDFISTASLGKNRATMLEITLRAKPRTITLRNHVPGATINGTPCGTNWVFPTAEIAQPYSFEATAPGYETNHLSLRIDRPGEDLVTDLVLQPLMGGIAIKLIPLDGTELRLDGVPRDPSNRGLLRAGVYSLIATNPDYYPFTGTLEVTAHATNPVEVLLRPKPASVAIEVVPAVDFQVRDAHGSLLPITDGAVHPSPGPLTLTLLAKGFVPVQRDFLLEPNKAYLWKARIEREGAADFQRMKEKFQLLTTDPEVAPQLEKLGGTDWKALRTIEFDHEDLVRGARQYTEACARVSEIIQSFPERGRAWTNEIRAANAIDYWLLLGELAKATNELAQYAVRFGPKSDFEHWFGSTAGKIQSWRDSVESKQRYLPEKPAPKKR